MGKKKAPSPCGQLFTFSSIWRTSKKNKMLFDWSRPGQGIKKSRRMLKQECPHTDSPWATWLLLLLSSQHPGQRVRPGGQKFSLLPTSLISLFLSEAPCPPQVPCHEVGWNLLSHRDNTVCVLGNSNRFSVSNLTQFKTDSWRTAWNKITCRRDMRKEKSVTLCVRHGCNVTTIWKRNWGFSKRIYHAGPNGINLSTQFQNILQNKESTYRGAGILSRKRLYP